MNRQLEYLSLIMFLDIYGTIDPRYFIETFTNLRKKQFSKEVSIM